MLKYEDLGDWYRNMYDFGDWYLKTLYFSTSKFKEAIAPTIEEATSFTNCNSPIKSKYVKSNFNNSNYDLVDTIKHANMKAIGEKVHDLLKKH